MSLSKERQKEIAAKLGITLQPDESVSEEMLEEFLHESYSEGDRV